MKTLTTCELVTVAGGVSKTNDALTAQLTALQGSIKDVASSQNNKPNDIMLPMVMMMAMRPQQQAPTVVAAGGPSVSAGPVVNISNRFRHW